MSPATGSSLSPPLTWADLFADADLPRPPIPATLVQNLEPVDPEFFQTGGWPDCESLDDLARDWVNRPSPERAQAGFCGMGVQSRAVQVCIARPEAGFFLRRRWTQAFGQGPLCQRRIEGAFGLLAQALEQVDALIGEARWPQGRRLLVIDDEFSQQRWGWFSNGDDLGQALRGDSMAYLGVLAELAGLRDSGKRSA